MSTEPIDCLGSDQIDLTANDMGRSTPWYERVLGRLGFDLFREESASGSVIFMNGITSIAIRPCAAEQQGEEFDRYRVGPHGESASRGLVRRRVLEGATRPG